MRLLNKILIITALFTIIAAACNPTRDRWINRKWHTLTGHFNVYFNGEQKLLDATTQIEKSHADNFNQVLDVYPLGTEQAAKTAGNLIDEANKKFSATIQLHTIGSYTDEAYFGIAKCQYYKRDYYAALETFQYVNTKYKSLGYKNITTNWVARCYVGLKKPEEAEAIMGLLLAEKNFAKNDIAEIYATAADVNIKLQKYNPAIEQLKKALTGKVTKTQKIRYNYILGQLFFLANKKPESIYHFDKVISYNPSYEFEFNANINLTKIYDVNDKKSVARVRRNLKHMSNDDKNLEFLDQIYFELGKLELSQKNYNAAVSAFKKSVAVSTKNKNQKANSYLALAKHYFNTKSYDFAKAYYDSTVITLDPTHAEYEKISNTKNVLSELIGNLKVYEAEDSLLKLSNLSSLALEQKIDGWIANKKREEELAAKLAKKNKQLQESMAQNQSINTNINNFTPSASGGGEWYFYNAQLVANGQADFYSARKWGQRKNEDFWRIAAKEKPVTDEEKQDDKQAGNSDGGDDKTGTEVKQQKPKTVLTGNADKDKWITNVPFTAEQKTQSHAKMLEALHNLGIIYYDKLQNPEECIKYLNILQARYPVSDYEPDAFYYLYKANTDVKQQKPADKNKNDLISTYPEHPYSFLVQNKTIKTVENTGNKELEQLYQNMYFAYNSAEYAKALSYKTESLTKFPGNTLRPKFELLTAFCLAKTNKPDEFKNQLNYIIKDFAGTDEAKSAAEILQALNKAGKREAIEKSTPEKTEQEFDAETETSFYFVFALKNPKADFTEFNSKFYHYNTEYASLDNLRSNAMVSNEGYQILLVRDFANFAKALDYYNGVLANKLIEKKLGVTEPYICYVVSTNNFKKILKENKIEAFNTYFKKQLKLSQEKP